MPLKNGRLTPKELRFAEAFARTNDADYAARKAGYSGAYEGNRLMTREAVADRVKALIEKRMEHSVGLAFDTMDRVMTDKAASDANQIAAGGQVLRIAKAYAPPSPEAKSDDDKSLVELHRDIVHLYVEAREIGMQIIEHQAEAEPVPLPNDGIFG